MNPLNLDPNVNYLAQPRAVDVPEWRKSLASFGDETAALGSGLRALGAQVVGATDMRDQALLDFQRNTDAATAGWQAPEVGQIEGIKLTEPGGVGRLGSYLGYQVPKGLAQLGSMVVSGLGAGAVARTFASKGIKELAKAEMKNLAADVAKKAVATPLVEREAGKVAIQKLAERQLLGMQVGATAGIAGMEGGQMYGKLANDPIVGPDAAVLPTLAYTGIATALEYLPLHMAGKAIDLDRFLLRKVIKEDPGLAAKAAELSLKKKALGVVGKIAGGAVAGAATEGITEGLQSLTEQAATKYAQQDPQWASILPTTKEGWSDFWNSAAAGGATGFFAGAALGPLTGAKRPAGEVNVPEAEAQATPARAGVPPSPQPPVGQAPAEAAPSTPSAASPEVTPNAVPMPGRPEENPAAPGEGAAAASTPPTAERPQIQPAGGEVQAIAQPDGGWSVVAADGLIARDVPTEQEAAQIRDQEITDRAARGQVVKTTTSPQEAPTTILPVEPQQPITPPPRQMNRWAGAEDVAPEAAAAATWGEPITNPTGATVRRSLDGNFFKIDVPQEDGTVATTYRQVTAEPSNAQQDTSTSPVYENVPRPEQQGGQEVQMSTEEGGQRVLPGGQEQVQEVIGKADGTPFATKDAATRKLNQLWAQGGMQIQEGSEAGKQARARVAKQGDGYVIERLESREATPPDTDSTGNRGTFEQGNPNILESRTTTQTETPEFKRWAQNLPVYTDATEYTAGPAVLRLYHGTRYLDEQGQPLTEFKPDMAEWTPFARMLGSHFAADPDMTQAFTVGPYARAMNPVGTEPKAVLTPTGRFVRPAATKETIWSTPGLTAVKPGGHVLPVFVRTEKPYVIPAGPSDDSAVADLVIDKVFAEDTPLTRRVFEEWTTKTRYMPVDEARSIPVKDRPAFIKNYNAELNGVSPGSRKAVADRFWEILRSEGYDSIEYTNVSGNEIWVTDPETGKEVSIKGKRAWIVPTDSGQIKSAIGNRGTWDESRRILESRTSTPTQSTTDFVAQTDSVLGQGWTQRAIDAGILVVNETSPANSASGYFEPSTGKFVVNLDRTPERQSPVDVLLHEGSHASMARMLGGQFASFHKDLERLAEQGSATAKLAVLRATVGAIENINRQRVKLKDEPYPHRLGDETLPVAERANEIQRVRTLVEELRPGLLAEEDLAYYIQLASSAKPAEVGYWRRLLTAIQAWVAQTNFGKAMATIGWRPELSPQLAVELAKQAAQATLRRAELVNTLVGERAKVLRSLPAAAQMGVMESYIGVKANKVAYGMPYKVATSLEQRGWDIESIRQTTGWHRGADGKWRFELDDSKAILHDLTSLMTPLSEDNEYLYHNKAMPGKVLWKARLDQLLEHPQLYTAYPRLKQMPVMVSFMNGIGASGNFTPSDSSIQINAPSGKYDKEMQSALLHEIQHAIQQIEDFDAGLAHYTWNESLRGAWEQNPGEQEAVDVQKRMTLSDEARVTVPPKVLFSLVKQQTGDVLESRETNVSTSWWRSGVATAVASAPQQKAAPQQWLGWLKNQPGVKQEEIDDLGLEDWLEAQEGSVQKAEVERFVRGGGVRIEEVLKLPAEVRNEMIRAKQQELIAQGMDRREAAFVASEEVEKVMPLNKESLPKFATYQVPGGENYRELLIMVPSTTAENWSIKYTDGSSDTKYGEYPTQEAAQAALVESGETDIAVPVRDDFVKPENQYSSSHWSEPNVLVHIRFNERTDTDGKRVLFVEEVQSDWHQEGRKKGYGPVRLEVVYTQRVGGRDLPQTEAFTLEQRAEAEAFATEVNGTVRESRFGKEGQTVPNAPLKSAWPLLGMKRAIRWAAEHGFDSVAWTPGQIQFDRYGSEAFTWSKRKNEDGWFLNGEEQQGGNAFVGMEDQLAKVAIQRGQPVSTKGDVRSVVETIMDRQRSDYGQTQWEAHLTKLTDRLWARMQEEETGVMLPRKEGMEGFYDRSVPNKLKEYAKKFGAKVGETEILGEKANAKTGWESTDARVNDSPSIVAWSLPITPALRDEALTGQLLYSLPFSGWELPKSFHTSPLSVYPEDFNVPGTFDRVFNRFVDMFSYVKDKSPDLYRAFDEWKNRQGAMMQEVQRIYLYPIRHWVARYAPLAGDSEPIRRTELASGKITNKNQQYDKVEIVGHQLAARHILEDKVTEQLALRAAPDFLKELKKQLSPHNVGLLNAEIKLRTGGSIQISKLSNTDARQLFESYLPSANPQSDIGQRWILWNRRSAGYSIATPGTLEAQQDEIDGFINAHELYTNQVKNREIFKRIAELSDKLAVHQLGMLQEGDLLQQADVDRLSRAYPHYVPLRREAFDYDRELAEMFDKPVANVGKLMTREGSIASESASAVHVLQNHLAGGFAAASAAARNQMMNKFADVLYQDINGWKPWFYIKDEKVHKNDIGFIRGGKTLYIVPAEGNLRAASIIKVIAGKDAEQLSGPFTVMRHINNWIRWTNVSASPAFMLANTPRDYLTARYNLLATDAATYANEIGSMKSYKESYKALYKVLVQGVRETTDPQVQSWIDLVEDFEKSGGKTSFVEALKAMDGDSWKSFEAQVGRREGKKGAVVEWGRNKLEWLENLNIVLENVMRLSTYKVMRGKVGKERAAEIARNLTTNFTRKGAHIDAINTWWLFYNATVQGNWQVVQNLFFNPNKAGQRRLQKAVAGTVAFAFFIDQLGRAFSDDEDDDGISDWDSRPANDKERKISSPFKDPITGTYLSIPAPWVFNIFWRMGGMLGEVKDGVLKPQDALLDSVALTMNAMDPVGGFKALTGEGTMAQSISPTAFDPFMQMIENRDFRGNPLGPDGYPGASKRPDAYLTWDSTPQGFKTVAQFVNEVTGGSPVESGKADFRPSSYKVLWDTIWGGVGRTGWDLAGLMGAPFSEEEFKGAEKLPLVKTFLTAPNDSTAISLYHDRAAQVLGAKRLEKMYSEGPEQNPQKLAEVQQARAAVLRMVPQIEDTERQIKALRKTLRSAQARGDSRTEEQLRDRIVQLQKRFNQSYSRRVGN